MPTITINANSINPLEFCIAISSNHRNIDQSLSLSQVLKRTSGFSFSLTSMFCAFLYLIILLTSNELQKDFASLSNTLQVYFFIDK